MSTSRTAPWRPECTTQELAEREWVCKEHLQGLLPVQRLVSPDMVVVEQEVVERHEPPSLPVMGLDHLSISFVAVGIPTAAMMCSIPSSSGFVPN